MILKQDVKFLNLQFYRTQFKRRSGEKRHTVLIQHITAHWKI